MPAAPAPRAALPREDTTGSNATEEHGSKDAMRLSSVREIGDFPLAVIVITVRHFGIDRTNGVVAPGKQVQ